MNAYSRFLPDGTVEITSARGVTVCMAADLVDGAISARDVGGLPWGDARDVAATLGLIQVIRAKRINNDAYGNPRYVIWYGDLLTDADRGTLRIGDWRPTGLARGKALGGRQFRGRSFGGGIVFQSYSTEELARDISRVTGRPSIIEVI